MALPQDESERQRVRDLSRFYRATNPLEDEPPKESGSSGSNCAVNLPPEGFTPVLPRLSSDPVLTAFAQLAAHKLSCERSFISIIDGTTQYIIAEATRSISLVHDNQHAKDDGLYLGMQTLPINWGVCPSTIRIFTDRAFQETISTPNIFANTTQYIIKDFAKEPVFVNRPYIVGWPHMRFYAEVPVKSHSGYVIGSICVVDNEPREKFTDEQVAELQEISSVITRHLENVIAEHTSRRTERLMESLNRFMEGESSSVKDPVAHDSGDEETNRSSSTLAETRSSQEFVPFPLSEDALRAHPLPPSNKQLTRMTSLTSLTTASSNSEKQSTANNSATTVSSVSDCLVHDQDLSALLEARGHSMSQTRPQIYPLQEYQIKALDEAEHDASPPVSLASSSMRTIFSRASNMIRKSMDLEGVIYLDACLDGFSDHLQSLEVGDSSERAPAVTEPKPALHDSGYKENPIADSNSDAEAHPSWSTPLNGSGTSSEELPAVLCETLGFSTRSLSSIAGDKLESNQFSMPEASLQRLCERHSRGAIFDFDEGGYVASVTEADSGGEVVDAASGIASSGQRDVDTSRLSENFPGARSMVFFPLWDSPKGRWFAAGFGWTNNPRRGLTQDEVVYYAAFGKCIMSEVSRSEALTNSRAKSDFISSFSHELRSPLNGILASAELLEPTSTGSGQSDLIDMISSCGRNLLDTMNHLFAFAKIDNAKSKTSPAGLQMFPAIPTHAPRSSESAFNLAAVVEEVVDAVYAGYRFSRRPGPTSAFTATPVSRLSVIIDISPESCEDIISETGAWKRILMNLFGNSLKYTTEGYIQVSLAVSSISSNAGEPQHLMSLSVLDTGKGISKEYLKYQLFTPFAQEDSLSVGTGLGLSIVHKIVLSLGGETDIQSEPGIGTKITVSVPLRLPHETLQYEVPEAYTRIHQSYCTENYENSTVCILGLSQSTNDNDISEGVAKSRANGVVALRELLVRNLLQFFKMKVVFSETPGFEKADVLIVQETYFIQHEKSLLASNVPIILLENGEPESRASHFLSIFRLSQPFGLRKLAKALTVCLAPQSARRPSFIVQPNAETGTISDTYVSIAGSAVPISSADPNDTLGPSLEPTSEDAEVIGFENAILEHGISKKFLLVDDNDVNLKVMIAFIRSLSCSYEIASDGLQALECYKRANRSAQPFDCILMDISMPIMNGLESTRRIRAFEDEIQPTRPAIVVVLSGLTSLITQQEAISSGVDHFMTKPVQLKALKVALGMP